MSEEHPIVIPDDEDGRILPRAYTEEPAQDATEIHSGEQDGHDRSNSPVLAPPVTRIRNKRKRDEYSSFDKDDEFFIHPKHARLAKRRMTSSDVPRSRSGSPSTPARRKGKQKLAGKDVEVKKHKVLKLYYTDNCVLCLDEMVLGDGKATFDVGCGHSVHVECVQESIKVKSHGKYKCPSCRKEFNVTYKSVPVPI